MPGRTGSLPLRLGLWKFRSKIRIDARSFRRVSGHLGYLPLCPDCVKYSVISIKMLDGCQVIQGFYPLDPTMRRMKQENNGCQVFRGFYPLGPTVRGMNQENNGCQVIQGFYPLDQVVRGIKRENNVISSQLGYLPL